MAGKPKQNVVDSEHKFTRLYEDGHASSPFLHDSGNKLAEAMRKAFPNLLGDVEFSQGPVKSWDRAAAKLANKAGGLDISKTENVADIVRGRIVIDTPDQVRAIREILNDPDQRAKMGIEHVKDRFAVPSDTHYRDINLSVRLENGHLAEVQINQRDMLAASEFTHDSYEDMDAIYKKSRFENRDMTSEEFVHRQKLKNYTRDVHDYGASKVPGIDSLLSDKGRMKLAGDYAERQKVDPEFRPGVTIEANTKYGVPFVNRAEAYGGEGYKALAKQYGIAPDRLEIDTSSLEPSTMRWDKQSKTLFAENPEILADMFKRHGTSLARYKELGADIKTPDNVDLSKAFNRTAQDTKPKAAHTQPSDALHSRIKSGAHIGASGFGLGAGGYYAYQAYKDGDDAGMVLAGGNIVVSGIDTGMDIARAAGKEFAPALGRTMMKANMGMMLIDGAYQVYREDGNFIDPDGGLGHKGERAIAVTTTAGAGIGTGMLLGGTGTTVGSGALITTVGAAAVPVILTGSAVYASAKFADTMIEYRRLKDSLNEEARRGAAPLKFAQNENGVPSLINYKQSMFSASRYSGFIRSDHINGLVIRDEETGRITNLRDIDWTDERNLAEFETMLDNQIAVQQQILEANSSFWPDLFRNTDSIDREYFANIELMMLGGAKEELAALRQEVAAYKAAQNLDAENDFDHMTLSRLGEEIIADDILPDTVTLNDKKLEIREALKDPDYVQNCVTSFEAMHERGDHDYSRQIALLRELQDRHAEHQAPTATPGPALHLTLQ